MLCCVWHWYRKTSVCCGWSGAVFVRFSPVNVIAHVLLWWFSAIAFIAAPLCRCKLLVTCGPSTVMTLWQTVNNLNNSKEKWVGRSSSPPHSSAVLMQTACDTVPWDPCSQLVDFKVPQDQIAGWSAKRDIAKMQVCPFWTVSVALQNMYIHSFLFPSQR